MKFTLRESCLAVLLIVVCIGWYVDRQRQVNLANVAQRQMDRYSWQADKLSQWISKSETVKSIDVNYDTITINHVDGQGEVFTRSLGVE